MAVVTAIAAVTAAVGSLIKGQAESDALDYQAKIQANNAVMAKQAAGLNADRQQLIAGQKIGAMKTEFAASGVDINTSGSVLDVIGASAANAELDKQNILHGGDVRAVNFDNQASLDRTAGGNARSGSYYSAAGYAMSGAAKIYGYGSGGKNKTASDDLGIEED